MANRARRIGGMACLLLASAGCPTLNFDNDLRVYTGDRYKMSQVASSRLRLAAGLMAGDVKIKKIAGKEYINETYNSSELSQRIYQKLCLLADIKPMDWEISDEEAEKIFLIAYENAVKEIEGRK